MAGFLEAWISLAVRLAGTASWIGGGFILASAGMIATEVLLRKLLLVSLGGADEISGYAFAVGTSWALAFTLLERANVRVDALYMRFAGRVRACCDVLALASLALFVGLLGWHALHTLAASVQYASRATTPLATPLWIPQGLWVAGFGLFLFCAAPLILRSLLALIAGDFVTVRRLAGARTVQEDAAQESSHLRAAPPGYAPR